MKPWLNVVLAAATAIFAAFVFNRRSTAYFAVASHYSPDVAAVVLNWARLSNVKQIVSELCADALDGVIKEIIVWNNSPHSLADSDFVKCNCSHKLRIHNSPENLYFQARFMACSSATTTYCFIQDDDYLVRPEVIRSLRWRIDKRDIFVLPPDEALSSRLLSINSTEVHFEFAWLGYGALILRKHATSFLSLLRRIGASSEEFQMADNYYSILKNSFPEIWTAEPVALFGGNAFTVGDEGLARNRRHIAAATKYLDAIIDSAELASNQPSENSQWPYVCLGSLEAEPRLDRSPCTGALSRCLLESSIPSLPEVFDSATYTTAGKIFEREAELSKTMSAQLSSDYVTFPLSRAVDGDRRSSFRSFRGATEGDTLVLDVFDTIQQMNWLEIQWSWLVDVGTADILRTSTYSWSSDNQNWAGFVPPYIPCAPISVEDNSTILECHVVVTPPQTNSLRYLRLHLTRNYTSQWRIYETWLHGIENPISVASAE